MGPLGEGATKLSGRVEVGDVPFSLDLFLLFKGKSTSKMIPTASNNSSVLPLEGHCLCIRLCVYMSLSLLLLMASSFQWCMIFGVQIENGAQKMLNYKLFSAISGPTKSTANCDFEKSNMNLSIGINPTTLHFKCAICTTRNLVSQKFTSLKIGGRYLHTS